MRHHHHLVAAHGAAAKGVGGSGRVRSDPDAVARRVHRPPLADGDASARGAQAPAAQRHRRASRRARRDAGDAHPMLRF